MKFTVSFWYKDERYSVLCNTKIMRLDEILINIDKQLKWRNANFARQKNLRTGKATPDLKDEDVRTRI